MNNLEQAYSDRILLVGDVHAVPEELEDCDRLIDLIVKVAKEEEVGTVLFLGDQYDTHNVVRVEVLAFWASAFEQLKAEDLSVMALVGNHDYAGEGLVDHALMAHEHSIRVIDKPTNRGGILLLPYISSRDEFVEVCKNHPEQSTVICHQTFNGATYDNGFYAPDGVDQNDIPQKTVISGHIHLQQAFGKVTYVGAPRWRTLSDADSERAIWVYEFGQNGTVLSKEGFDTSKHCRPIRYRLDTPEKPVEGQLDPGCDWRIDIKGPIDWIEKRKTELAGHGVKIRTFKTDKIVPKIKESDGIGKAFDRFLSSYTPRYGTEIDRLKEIAKERLGGI
jgi:DNA repair exonuclease SbcCD nuclease subunit